MKSIISDKQECFICHSTHNLQMHHIFFGTANRKLSEENGLKVWLCWDCHEGGNGVHHNRELDLWHKKMAQKKFEETHSREEFMKIFGKNYLD